MFLLLVWVVNWSCMRTRSLCRTIGSELVMADDIKCSSLLL